VTTIASAFGDGLMDGLGEGTIGVAALGMGVTVVVPQAAIASTAEAMSNPGRYCVRELR
jgi:hypothetical protein